MRIVATDHLYPNVQYSKTAKIKIQGSRTNKKQFITEKILDFKIKDFFDCMLGSNPKSNLNQDRNVGTLFK